MYRVYFIVCRPYLHVANAFEYAVVLNLLCINWNLNIVLHYMQLSL